MARNRQKEFEQLINYDKVTREKILYEQRKRSLQHFEVDFLLLINAQTKNLLLEFMQFLAYTDSKTYLFYFNNIWGDAVSSPLFV